MYDVAAASADGQMLCLWLLNILYFGGTVFYIKLKVRIHLRQQPPDSTMRRLLVGKATVAYRLGAITLTALLGVTGLVPLLAPLVYVPVICKAVQGALAWQQRVSVKRLGVMEIMHSLIFAALLVLVYSRCAGSRTGIRHACCSAHAPDRALV